MSVQRHLLRRGCRGEFGLVTHSSPFYALSRSLPGCGSHVLISCVFRFGGSSLCVLGKRKSPGAGFWGVGSGMHNPVRLRLLRSWLRELTADE